ncbi:MAG: YmdB family metallophosphoesterase [Candidatus Kerfeldbacteria bacterium]|nr:YmdB family metallophosphoesterase [Candidatus Kerfeldbacteria bacterium]
MKVLFFGDIIGRAGRRAVAEILPKWRRAYEPEVVIGNVENLSHGKGVTTKALKELISLGFEAFTSGDHVFHGGHGQILAVDPQYKLIRPLNCQADSLGMGSLRLSLGSRDLLLVNLAGRVFMPEGYESPFTAMDKLLAVESPRGNLAGVLVDVHAEATSEKVALGWYLDGRVSAVLGTHTHVPTADAWILPQGTAYLTDVGMTGIRESVIGVKTELSLGRFLTGGAIHFEPAEVGTAVINAALVTIDSVTTKATAIERLQEFITLR